MAIRNSKRKEREGGDLLSAEIIAEKVALASRVNAKRTQKRGMRTTAVSRQLEGLDNDGVHRLNESARQLDSQDLIERDSERPTQYREAKRLDAPDPRPGMSQRWVSYRKGSAEDEENFDGMLEEGWIPRKRMSVKRGHELATSTQGPLGQYYVKRGLILMEIPTQRKVERDRYVRGLNKRQNDGVDKSMFRVENRVMPLLRPERSTRATVRARKGRLEAAPDDLNSDA